MPDLVQNYCEKNFHPHPATTNTKRLKKQGQNVHLKLAFVVVVVLIYLTIPGCLTLLKDTFFPKIFETRN